PGAGPTVHEDELGQGLLRQRERLVTVVGLADHVDLRLVLADRAKTAPDERVVAREQHTDLVDLARRDGGGRRPKSLPRQLAFSLRSTSSIAPCWSVSSTVSAHAGVPSSVTARSGIDARTIVPRPASLRTTI